MRRFFNLKTFVMFIMAASLLTAVTSCKDYDDDINNLQKQIDGISGMKTDLSKAIDAVKTAAANADKRAEDARKAAEAAQKTADAAKKAAEDAAAKGVTADQLAAVKAIAEEAKAKAEEAKKAVKAAEKAAEEAKAKAAELEKQIKDLQARVEALEKAGNQGGVSQEDIDKVKAELEKEIAEVLAKVDALVGKRLTSISLVPKDHINGIAAINITSLKYDVQSPVPHKPYQYTTEGGAPRTIDAGATVVDFRLSPRYVTKMALDFPYFESWTSYNVVTKGHDQVGKNTPIAPVEGQDLMITDEGILKLKVEKTIDEPINATWNTKGDKEEFYMVSLAIPIAKDYWTPSEIEANEVPTVTSEGYRLAETTDVPRIKNKTAKEKIVKSWDPVTGQPDPAPIHYRPYALDEDGKVVHYSDKTILYQSVVDEKIDEQVDWKEGIDLMTLVTVCTEDDHSTLENYKDYGLAFKFTVAEDPYLQGTNQTDQQKFAKVNPEKDGKVMLTSQVYTIGGATQTAIGREPIIRVDLVNTKKNNELVDRRYIKIKWTQKVEIQDLPDYSFDGEYVSCDNVVNRLGTQAMNEDIYRQVEKKYGISKEQFHGIYKTVEIKTLKRGSELLTNENGVDVPTTVTFKENDEAATEDVKLYMIEDANDNTSYNIVWEMSPKAVGKIPVDTKKQTYVLSFIFKSSVKGYGDIHMDFITSVKLPEQAFAYQGTYWDNGVGQGIFNVNPIVYKPGTGADKDGWFENEANGGTPALDDYSHIEADLVNGYIYKGTNKKPANLAQFIAYIRTCAKVRFEFAPERFADYAHLAGYIVNPDNTELWNGPITNLVDAKTEDEEHQGVNAGNAPDGMWDYIQDENLAATINNKFGATALENKINLPWDFAEELGSGNNEATAIIRLHEKTQKKGTPAANNLVGKKVPVNLVVEYNAYNKVPVQKFDVFFINPLTVNGEIKDHFKDAVVSGSFVSVEEGFGFTDWNFYKVARKASTPPSTEEKEKYAEQLYEYYAVNQVVFDTDKITTSLFFDETDQTYKHKDGVTDGELPTDRSVKQVKDVDLTATPPTYTEVNMNPTHLGYFNNNGTPVNVAYSMFVNVEVGYKWGTMNKNGIEIKVEGPDGVVNP